MGKETRDEEKWVKTELQIPVFKDAALHTSAIKGKAVYKAERDENGHLFMTDLREPAQDTISMPVSTISETVEKKASPIVITVEHERKEE